MPIPTKFLAALGVVALALFDLPDASAQSTSVLADLPAALEALIAKGDPLAFGRGEFNLPVGGHLQGIQTTYDAAGKRQLVVISHDSLTVAYLAVASFPAANETEFKSPGLLERVEQLPSDGQSPPLRHAGGMQLAGKVLAVGVEDNQEKKRSQIQFWNMTDQHQLEQLAHLTIARSRETPKEATAGAVGLIERASDFLLAVGNWDCRAIDFYLSNGKPLTNPDCRFKHVLNWKADSAATEDWRPDSIRDTYQSLNLVQDAAGSVFLLGFNTTTSGEDVIDLFQVDLERGASRALRKLARKQVSLASETHFRYAGGATVRDGKLLILSSERNFKPRGETRLNVLRTERAR